MEREREGDRHTVVDRVRVVELVEQHSVRRKLPIGNRHEEERDVSSLGRDDARRGAAGRRTDLQLTGLGMCVWLDENFLVEYSRMDAYGFGLVLML